MKIATVVLFLVYVVLLGLKSGPPALPYLTEIGFGLEVAFDLLAIVAALRAGRKLIAGAFVATLISTCNWKVLSSVYHVKLEATRGTWLELEINAPYITFYLLSALALYLWARADRRQVAAGFTMSIIALGVSLHAMLPGLAQPDFGAQHRVLHVACWAVSAFIYGYGSVGIASLQPRRALVSLGFVSIALSGFFFQVTEIWPGAYALDNAMDLTWTLGQFCAIGGLLLSEDKAGDPLPDHRG